MKKNRRQIITLVSLALLSALVIVLQYFATFITILGENPALVLVPITIGAILFGPLAGAYLGFIFGFVVLVSGQAASYYSITIVGTIITVIFKGTLAGLFGGLVFNAIKKKNIFVAIIVACIVVPLTNSVVYRVGLVTFFIEKFKNDASAEGVSAFVYFFLSMSSINFVLELGLNIVLAPAISRICEIISNRLNLGVFDMKNNKIFKKDTLASEGANSTNGTNESLGNYDILFDDNESNKDKNNSENK